MIQRALVSVSDKTGLDKLAKTLHHYKVEILASGGTAKYIEDLKIPVTRVETLTQRAECFGGRMKTLSFEISSGILYRRNVASDVAEAKANGIKPIDLVVCNLYPFHQVVQNNQNFAECIENIDIGGPTMLRAAAKNFESVTVLCNPNQYENFIKDMDYHKGDTALPFRQACANEVFNMMFFYELEIAKYLKYSSGTTLRYGENSHQKAVKISDPFHAGLAHLNSQHGKDMSYNNYLDAEFAQQALNDIQSLPFLKDMSAAVVVKHNIPCGMAVHENWKIALEKAWQGDEKSSFGGVIAINFELTKEVAQFFVGKFIEVLSAPQISEEAAQLLGRNVRLIQTLSKNEKSAISYHKLRSIEGGLMVQDHDQMIEENLNVVTENRAIADNAKLAQFSIACVKNLKSNALALCEKLDKGFHLVTFGNGQPNRVDCLELLIAARLKQKKIHDVSQMVMASDAFFPFSDTVVAAAEMGIMQIVQPGGSLKDNEVIADANKKNISMALTGRRHFSH